MLAVTPIDPADVRPGDTFTHYVYRADGKGMGVKVTILRVDGMTEDRFGRPMHKWWCKRDDTGAEGWFTWGPSADIHIEKRGEL
ncbi:hypothetical protein [Tsukamurella paurometabola]|uniref:Uncharacterized protein n=1 Tax=Tsukamurella paurometabola TaxID=2061 RepID=A0ABS5NDP2_TSUPA|nr:hypothetical protein [Tsukamurella paurometabola]MBS4102389.1 hypothetical protein [Tsukamurella paurometabola]